MPRSASSRRYAEAIFGLATDADKVDEWRRQVDVACEVARDERAARLIDSPAVGFADRRRAVEELLAGRVDRQVLNLALLLAERGRFSLLPAVAGEYDALVRRARGIVGVTVTTPTPLSGAELKALRTKIEQLAAARVEVTSETDPGLLGGLRITIGDLQIDASVASRLARLRRQLVGGTT